MTTKDQEAAKDQASEKRDEQARQRSAKQGDAQQRGAQAEGMPEPTEADLAYGKADPSDPTLNSYDIDYQGAPERGDVNTTAYQGEPVNPDGFPQDIADVQEARRERNVKRTPEENVKAQTGQ